MPQDSSAPDTSTTVYIYDAFDKTTYLVSKKLLPKNFDELDNQAKHQFIVKKYSEITGVPYVDKRQKEPQENIPVVLLLVVLVAVFLVFFGTKILPKIKTQKLTTSQQYKYFLVSCVGLIIIGLFFNIPMLIVPPLFILSIALSISSRDDEPIQGEIEDTCIPPTATITYSPKKLIYNGNELNFSTEILVTVLTKHFPYFNTLDNPGKDKFLHRLQKFIRSKTFIIHDESGFREMPILISAAAIQLSFGFDKYLLFSFPNINIYPEEFLGVHPFIRYLEGNVSGSNINISWKHFLNGFQYPDDGQNVGLHEMAHAYHFQNFETGIHEDKDFIDNFPKYNTYANKAFSQESLPGKGLYSDYALRNFQEFWAESVEIFFEKPAQMAATYPDLYAAMCDLMNQRPC